MEHKLRNDFFIDSYHYCSLGEGSHGSVILGTNRVTYEHVAIKVVSRFTPSKQVNRGIFMEVNIMKLCHHPNIITFLDFYIDDDANYIVMEYAKYGDLLKYFTEGTNLPSFDIKTVFAQLVSAVEYCHANQIAHRDLKLENILITEIIPFTVKIADFGLATNINIDSLHSSFCGTFYYAAHEIICYRPYEPKKVDIWSLGVILFSMVTNHHPWPSDDIARHIRNLNYDKTLVKDKVLRDLISRILVPPEDRISLQEIKRHRWMLKCGRTKSFYHLCTDKYKSIKKRFTN